MKKVLVLGAGMVSRPLVQYLLDGGFEVTVATRTVAKAEKLVAGHRHGRSTTLDVDDDGSLAALVAGADLAVSLVPYTHHVKVARHCLARPIPMVTTSYVSDAMQALDGEARAKGVVLLNEIGVDPGIDHMSAMRVIHDVERRGGKLTRFHSYCGGLPAPEANDNPFGYKFSWSPRGVLMAGRNAARYLEDGKEVAIPGPELFRHHWPLDVPGGGRFEAYPNRNSLPYVDTYSIQGVRHMLRGTLRNPGWCDTLRAIADLGLLDDERKGDHHGLALADWLSGLVPGQGALRARVAARVGLAATDPVLDRLEWLGLFGAEPVPAATGTALDVMTAQMLARMPYRDGERDMIVLHHEFEAAFADGRREALTSTLIDFGVPGGDSSMARTVSLPAAIGVEMILTGKIALTGVQIPVRPEIYRPVLDRLATLGITTKEASRPLA
jgi:saccharopine dehydrogenase-like NADP-dependent oxidoreductase